MFFRGDIHVGEKETKGFLYWPDFDKSKGKAVQCEAVKTGIHKRDQFITWYISEQASVMKLILKRFCTQQLERLIATDFADSAKSAVTYCGDLKKLQSTGAVLNWIKTQENRLRKITPAGHAWEDIINQLIQYAHSYESRKEWDYAAGIASKIQPTINNNSL